MRIVLSFEVKGLPDTVDETLAGAASNGDMTTSGPAMPTVQQA